MFQFEANPNPNPKSTNHARNYICEVHIVLGLIDVNIHGNCIIFVIAMPIQHYYSVAVPLLQFQFLEESIPMM